ncbi:hypothetical protein FS749_003507 [Ceratobasidium sp. UAMH 11750]|nr:hypothetical protein FS749_003507 [Ceratobasidium sp. UAMH 11750]
MSPSRVNKGKGKASNNGGNNGNGNSGNSGNGGNSGNSGGNKRTQKETSRKREQRENDAEVARERAEKKRAVQERRRERAEEEDEDMFVEQDNETEREARLRELAVEAQARNDELQAQLSQMRAMIQNRERHDAQSTPGASGSGARSAPSTSSASRSANRERGGPAAKSIRAPNNLTKVTMGQIRGYLGLTNNTPRWLEIRALVRDFICMAALDFGESWSRQDPVRLGNLYSLMIERIPEFRRFTNNWAAELMVQDIFNHRRTYMVKKQKAAGEQEESVPEDIEPGSEPDSEPEQVAEPPRRSGASTSRPNLHSDCPASTPPIQSPSPTPAPTPVPTPPQSPSRARENDNPLPAVTGNQGAAQAPTVTQRGLL